MAEFLEAIEIILMLAGKTFVNIIESPSTGDLAAGRSEGKMLTEALTLTGLPHSYNLVSNYTQFMKALGKKTGEAIDQKLLPVIHLSMHGNQEGLVLTDGHFLTWADLNWKFRMINLKVAHNLFVCLSSCYGLSGLQMLRESAHGILKEQPPFRLLVSNLNPVPWSDAGLAFAAFYHLLERGKNPAEMVAGMRAASGNDGFFGLMTGNAENQVFVLGSDQLVEALAALGRLRRT